MAQDFQGKRVLVTAGGAGIGRRIAERFLAEGAKVMACDVTQAALADLPAGIAGRLCDVSKEDEVTALFAAAKAELGGLDILINGAGVSGETASIEESDPARWRQCLDVNLVGAFLCLKAGLPLLREAGGGAVINFSSTAGLFGYPYRSAYCAAKWAIIGLTKTAAQEAGPDKVRVNALCPGAVEGERMDRVVAAEAREKGISEEEVRAAYTRDSSLKAWVTADDIADAALFLCSDRARNISGQALPVDGNTETL
ncbi:SDR family oxidoreductase [Limibacillus halophilus]|jgi:NAD(P)-dependent dehydrogenase (short-subunit alcohol dehydrogenase family)